MGKAYFIFPSLNWILFKVEEISDTLLNATVKFVWSLFGFDDDATVGTLCTTTRCSIVTFKQTMNEMCSFVPWACFGVNHQKWSQYRVNYTFWSVLNPIIAGNIMYNDLSSYSLNVGSIFLNNVFDFYPFV